MKIKNDNRGNTLAIVLVGIFVLAILGTMILGITANNLNMKVAAKRSEMTLYKVEKASDELYSTIGADAMDTAKASYSEVVENYVTNTAAAGASPTYVKLTTEESKEAFRNYYWNGKTESSGYVTIEGICANFPDTSTLTDENKTTAINNLVDMFNNKSGTGTKYFDNSDSKYNIYVENVSTNPIEIVYNYDAATGTKLESIDIKNVCITCETTNGYYSSVLTDYNIQMPDLDMNFIDSDSENDADAFFSYAIIAQGSGELSGLSDKGQGLVVTNNNNATSSGVNITGNVYAGSSNNRNAVEFSNGVNARVNSKVFVSDGSLVVNESQLVMRNLAGAADITDSDTLQLYAGNISTEGNSANKSSIDIAGDLMVADDLEVNDDDSKVTISGNYFGYGFRSSAAEGNLANIEANTEESIAVRGTGATASEHKQTSSIIINASGSNCDFTGLDKLVLAGRAYIDLDSSTSNASYMTGESVSIKGNQSVYLADTELNGSKVAGNNPISYSDLQGIFSSSFTSGDTDGSATYSNLGLNLTSDNQVVAKLIDDDVYFYERTTNPTAQTQYFVNAFNKNTNSKRSVLAANIAAMKTSSSNLTLKFGSNLKSYTVGAIVQADNGVLNNSLIYGENGISKSSSSSKLGVFSTYNSSNTITNCGILDDIKIRKSNLVPALIDRSEDSRVGEGTTTDAQLNTNEDTYEYFLDQNELSAVTGTIEYQNLEAGSGFTRTSGNLGLENEQAAKLGKILTKMFGYSSTTEADANENIGVLITCQGGIGAISPTFNKGVIITNHPVIISHDFEGIIISNESITVYDQASDADKNGTAGIDVKANLDLAKALFAYIPELQKIFRQSVTYDGLEQDEDVVKSDSLMYTDLVSKDNWRRNYK